MSFYIPFICENNSNSDMYAVSADNREHQLATVFDIGFWLSTISIPVRNGGEVLLFIRSQN